MTTQTVRVCLFDMDNLYNARREKRRAHHMKVVAAVQNGCGRGVEDNIA
jgi:hypothetical protein